MDLTADEVKEYWRDYCKRHKVAADMVAKGEAKIDEDPDYWADQTMIQLLESLSSH